MENSNGVSGELVPKRRSEDMLPIDVHNSKTGFHAAAERKEFIDLCNETILLSIGQRGIGEFSS